MKIVRAFQCHMDKIPHLYKIARKIEDIKNTHEKLDITKTPSPTLSEKGKVTFDTITLKPNRENESDDITLKEVFDIGRRQSIENVNRKLENTLKKKCNLTKGLQLS
ncbi:hypothetical protein G9A89_002236 [Geosiphon pyriformis]|nr:hypothetical protein G9A89_002236 [Geosiphon pyriformis]